VRSRLFFSTVALADLSCTPGGELLTEGFKLEVNLWGQPRSQLARGRGLPEPSPPGRFVSSRSLVWRAPISTPGAGTPRP
jgi:hypothetical protein